MNPETCGSIGSTFQSNGIVNVACLRVVDGDAGLSREVNSPLVSRKETLMVVDQLPGFKQQLSTESAAPGRT